MQKTSVKGFSLKGNRREVMATMRSLSHHKTTGHLIRSMAITRTDEAATASGENSLWIFPLSYTNATIHAITGGAR